jgi:hypothetical protein
MRHPSHHKIQACAEQLHAPRIVRPGRSNFIQQSRSVLASLATAKLSDIEPAAAELGDQDLDGHAPIAAHHAAAFLFSCARATLALRMQRLDRVIESVRRRRTISMQRAPAFDRDRNRELVAIFDRLSPVIFSSRHASHLSSLALIEFLALYDSFPTWIWGVTTAPWYEHSWVQQEGWVFNETLDRVLRFTPVLAI